MLNKITVEQIERILIDAGVVYVNYGLENERLLAPCRGDNAFEVEAEIREVEVNGVKGKTKGLRRKISENASLSLNLMDLDIENMKMALPGSVITENKLTNGWTIDASDYVENVVLIGELMGGKYKKITIYNALVDGQFNLTMNEKDESVMNMVFSAHYDPSDSEDSLWVVEDLESLEESEDNE